MKLILSTIAVLMSLKAGAQAAPWLTDARKVVGSFPPKLLQVLNE